jgi:broad specificity phosphatase PhoE
VLVVGHAGVNRVIICELLGMPIENIFRLRQDYGCLNVLESAGTGWTVRRVNIPAGVERRMEE